jgi:proteasome accessory factor C
VFRIDRIQQADPTDESFDPPAEPPEPRVHYTPGVDDVRARIRLTPAAGWVADYYPVETLEEGPDGSLIEFSAGDAAVAARLLLRLGGDAELVAGDEVSAARDGLVARIAERYGVTTR